MGSGDLGGFGVFALGGSGEKAESSMIRSMSRVEREVPSKLNAKLPMKECGILWSERMVVRAAAACRRAENEGAPGPLDWVSCEDILRRV